MNVLIVLSHPDPASFNHALAAAIAQGLRSAGHAAELADLHVEGFDPRQNLDDVRALHGQGPLPPALVREQLRLARADGLVFVYPTWWFERPAMLKGWCDRVLTSGFAFRFGPSGPEGMLAAKCVWIVTTTGMPEPFYARHGGFESILRPMIAGTLGICGIAAPKLTPLFSLPFMPPAARTAALAEVQAQAAQWCAPA
ncbi:MAG: NAD(P)H-dependent oxidoreductase [bacterium]|jgi:NAD(P)H dehydrogenase (quinone)